MANPIDDRVRRDTAGPSARTGDDTVRTGAVATILHLDHWAASHARGRQSLLGRFVSYRWLLLRRDVLTHNVEKAILISISHDQDAVDGHIFANDAGIASGGNNKCVRVHAARLTEYLPRLRVTRVGYGTSVNNVHIGMRVKRRALKASRTELINEGIGLSLIDLAAESIEGNGCRRWLRMHVSLYRAERNYCSDEGRQP